MNVLANEKSKANLRLNDNQSREKNIENFEDLDIQDRNDEKYNSINIHDEYIICSEKNSFDQKSNLIDSPIDNNFKGQMEKISLNDFGDDISKSINIGKNKQINNKEKNNINQDKNLNNSNNKIVRRDSNVINESLQDTSLELEEGIEKKDYLGVYKVYKLIEIRRGEKIIKCERRYDNFHEFYKRIKKVYPWCLIPKLTEKNALAKIINIDSNFYLKRKNQLSLFIKYIKQHKKLKETIEFKKFIRDPTFDSEFFKSSESFINEDMFAESLKQTDTIKGTLFGYFNNVSNLFKKEEENDLMENSNEKELKKMEKFYRVCLEDIKNLKNKMYSFISSCKSIGKVFTELSDNLMYIKDVNFKDNSIKPNLILLFKSSDELSKIESNFYANEGISFDDELDGFIAIIQGLCFCFDRYNNFLSFYKTVIKSNKENRNNFASNKIKNFFIDVDLLKREESLINEKKLEFEKNLFDEIKIFDSNYEKKYLYFINKFDETIKILTKNELNSMNNYSNYFK